MLHNNRLFVVVAHTNWHLPKKGMGQGSKGLEKKKKKKRVEKVEKEKKESSGKSGNVIWN